MFINCGKLNEEYNFYFLSTKFKIVIKWNYEKGKKNCNRSSFF